VAARFFSGLKGIHMRIVSLLGGLVKGKLLVTVLVSLALVGGTTVVMAATPGGQSVFHAVTGTSTSTAKVAVTVATKQVSVSVNVNSKTTTKVSGACADLTEAQQMVDKHHMRSATKDNGLQLAQAICALHNGTFKAVTSAGVLVTSSRHFTSAEIDQLLTLAAALSAQSMQDVHTVTDLNLVDYLAVAVQTCGSAASVSGCVQSKIVIAVPTITIKVTPPAIPTFPPIPTLTPPPVPTR